MKQLVIAVDCDDVLVPSTFWLVDMYNQRYGAQVTVARAHTSGNPEWGADRETVMERIYEIQRGDDYAAIAPYSQAVDVVSQLAQHHELHLVTARPSSVMSITESMLERFFHGKFDQVWHIGKDGSKGEICQNIGSNVLIDDNLRHLEAAASYGVSHGLWFGRYPWQDTQTHPDVTRCEAWDSVKKEIDRIANE